MAAIYGDPQGSRSWSRREGLKKARRAGAQSAALSVPAWGSEKGGQMIRQKGRSNAKGEGMRRVAIQGNRFTTKNLHGEPIFRCPELHPHFAPATAAAAASFSKRVRFECHLSGRGKRLGIPKGVVSGLRGGRFVKGTSREPSMRGGAQERVGDWACDKHSKGVGVGKRSEGAVLFLDSCALIPPPTDPTHHMPPATAQAAVFTTHRGERECTTTEAHHPSHAPCHISSCRVHHSPGRESTPPIPCPLPQLKLLCSPLTGARKSTPPPAALDVVEWNLMGTATETEQGQWWYRFSRDTEVGLAGGGDWWRMRQGLTSHPLSTHTHAPVSGRRLSPPPHIAPLSNTHTHLCQGDTPSPLCPGSPRFAWPAFSLSLDQTFKSDSHNDSASVVVAMCVCVVVAR